MLIRLEQPRYVQVEGSKPIYPFGSEVKRDGTTPIFINTDAIDTIKPATAFSGAARECDYCELVLKRGETYQIIGTAEDVAAKVNQ